MASTLLILAAAVLASAQAAKKDPKGSTIHFAALLPGNVNRFPFAFQKVLPALELAVANVTAVGGPLHGREIQVHHSNSECSTAIAMNHMFNFYIKKQAHVFFGPCCDYAGAPVARQLHYWKLPMLTPGAIALDFAEKKENFFDLVTRVGSSVNSLLELLLAVS
ncbi:atrial natriuretic peptide receptor 3-like [Littorina saxatilis]|uniref:atrial natriuretic peptide receptor 3-like n=1 Tax=Littorina saxatilis TaxID=31220 RepID=UPI0038B674CD